MTVVLPAVRSDTNQADARQNVVAVTTTPVSRETIGRVPFCAPSGPVADGHLKLWVSIGPIVVSVVLGLGGSNLRVPECACGRPLADAGCLGPAWFPSAPTSTDKPRSRPTEASEVALPGTLLTR